MGAHATGDAESKAAAAGAGSVVVAGASSGATSGSGAKSHPPLIRRATKAQREKHAANLAARTAVQQQEEELKLKAGLQEAAALAARKKELEQECKRDDAVKREAEAAAESARKALEAKRSAEVTARAVKSRGPACCLGTFGCMCVFCRFVDLDAGAKFAVSLDDESRRMVFGKTDHGHVVAAYKRGGIPAVRKLMGKNRL
jgi:hypothetical protein